jgi:hypothetical protein
LVPFTSFEEGEHAVTISRWFPAIGAALLLASVAVAADTGKKPAGDSDSSFGSLKADAAEVQKKAEAWLKAQKANAATLAKCTALWKADLPLLEKATQTLVLGDPSLGKLLATAKDADAPAPTELPKVLADKKANPFLRNTLALAYGKALVGRKVYEEGLEALLLVKAEESVDPASLYFHRAVCEHALMMKDNADKSIDKLLVDVSDSPERYRMVAALMHFDMLTWQEKDLGWIARKMGNIHRRLDLKRGGKATQKMQKEVLVRLDEMIKELENKQNQPSGGS